MRVAKKMILVGLCKRYHYQTTFIWKKEMMIKVMRQMTLFIKWIAMQIRQKCMQLRKGKACVKCKKYKDDYMGNEHCDFNMDDF